MLAALSLRIHATSQSYCFAWCLPAAAFLSILLSCTSCSLLTSPLPCLFILAPSGHFSFFLVLFYDRIFYSVSSVYVFTIYHCSSDIYAFFDLSSYPLSYLFALLLVDYLFCFYFFFSLSFYDHPPLPFFPTLPFFTLLLPYTRD